jgi:plasmid stabilization system protein ParE
MGCEVRWTAAARSDLEDIAHHIAVVLDSPRAAVAHLDAFLAAAERLSDFPDSHAIGEHPALASRNLRPCLVKGYVMLYEHDDCTITVHRIMYARRDYARIIGLG